jgi:hypothetical protein
MTDVLRATSLAFLEGIGITSVPRDWTVHASIDSVGRAAEAILQVWGDRHAMWSIQVRTAGGYTLIENGSLVDGSAPLEAPVPASPLETPPFLTAVAAAHGVVWDLATARCGGNRVLA